MHLGKFGVCATRSMHQYERYQQNIGPLIKLQIIDEQLSQRGAGMQTQMCTACGGELVGNVPLSHANLSRPP